MVELSPDGVVKVRAVTPPLGAVRGAAGAAWAGPVVVVMAATVATAASASPKRLVMDGFVLI